MELNIRAIRNGVALLYDCDNNVIAVKNAIGVTCEYGQHTNPLVYEFARTTGKDIQEVTASTMACIVSQLSLYEERAFKVECTLKEIEDSRKPHRMVRNMYYSRVSIGAPLSIPQFIVCADELNDATSLIYTKAVEYIEAAYEHYPSILHSWHTNAETIIVSLEVFINHRWTKYYFSIYVHHMPYFNEVIYASDLQSKLTGV